MKTKTINLSLPNELLKQADEVAKKEFRTRSELMREVLRRYILKNKLDELASSLQKEAKEKGFTEKDVERLIKEYRAGK